MFEIILNSKVFKINSNIRYFQDINHDIYTELISKHQYIVKSDVQNDTFESFIKYWLTREPPNICLNNISEYIQLSQEFDIMTDIIKLFQKFTKYSDKSSLYLSNKQYHEKIKDKTEQNAQSRANYQKIIQILFKKQVFNFNSNFAKLKYKMLHLCKNEDVKLIELLTLKTFEQNGLVYAINEEEKEATIFKNLTSNSEITIPRAISFESKEYLVTGINEGAFRRARNIKSINFEANSELRFIDKEAFKNSSIWSISIPQHVTRIGESAFFDCMLLIRVDFSKHSELKLIENYAFKHTSLSSISIPSKVTKICKCAFASCTRLKSINIPEDSELQSIENSVFNSSGVTKIFIPEKVSDLNEGWCRSASHLEYIKVDAKNKNFLFFENNFLIGKSDSKSSVFDVLLFARRDIKEAIIPSFIKHIAPFAFERCQIEKVEFPSDSKVETIGDSAFSESSIKTIKIPPHVIHIGENAFFFCKFLKCIEFSEHSELNLFENDMFSFSHLNSLYIPPSVKVLKRSWCRELWDLKCIKVDAKNKNFLIYENKFLIGKSDSKSSVFDVLLFALRDIKEAIIPSFIKHIAPFAFERCYIEKVEFPSDSKVETIGDSAFSGSSIKTIKIPSSVVQIDYDAFGICEDLKTIEMSNDSELKSIGKYCISYSSIECFTIPSKLVHLGNEWCISTPKLTRIIETMPKNENFSYFDGKFILRKMDSKSDIYDDLCFARRNIKEAIIPSFIKRISDCAFNRCKKLKNVRFSNESELRCIEKYAFSDSSIESISIPAKVTEIGEKSFDHCKKLKKVCFSKHAELKSIGSFAFSNTKIESLSIPQSVTEISDSAFMIIQNFKLIEIPEKSKLEFLNISMFKMSPNLIIMVQAELSGILIEYNFEALI